MENYFSNQVKLNQIILISLLSFFLIILESCKEDQILKIADEEYQLKSNTSDESASCPPATGWDCEIGNPDDCRTNNANNCGRRDLDPCEFGDDLWAFSQELVCELNKFINGCPYYEQQFPIGCSSLGTNCTGLYYASPAMLTLIPDFTPWWYCDESDCEAEFECTGEDLPKQHKAINVSYQNAMMQYVRTTVANDIALECNGERYIGKIEFHTCKSLFKSCSEEDCWNIIIYVVIEYWCCN